MSGAIVAAVILAGGAAASADDASRKAGHDLRDQPNGAAQLEMREDAAKRLEGMVQKLESDTPLSGAERALIDRTTKVADQQIQKATQDATQQALQAQAGTGFLKSERAADQVRKIQLEGSLGRQGLQVAREQQIQNLIERRKEQAFRANAGLLGLSVGAAPQGASGLPLGSVLASGLSGVPGMISQQNQQANQNQQNQALLAALRTNGSSGGQTSNVAQQSGGVLVPSGTANTALPTGQTHSF